MVPFKVRVMGLEQIRTKFLRLPNKMAQAVAQALYQEGEELLAESKTKYVPVDRGHLRTSGHATLPRRLGTIVFVDVGYGGPAAPYALRVHENPRAGKTGGVSPSGRPYTHWAKVGEWKYLETPFKKRERGMRSRIQSRIRFYMERRR